MEVKKKFDAKKAISLIIGYALGILIIFAPVIITGHLYNTSKVMGGLLISEFIVRSLSLVIGLLVIYDTTKSCL